MNDSTKNRKLSYADAGVDIEAGERAVDRIKTLAASTFNDQVLTGLGAFGGFFKPDFTGLTNPVFISSTDSVGTKLKLAFMTGRHNTVGEDLVNHCANDILVHGARPLFFLDYIGINKLKPDVIAELVAGLSKGCKNCGAALIGGETAELTDLYQPDEYDLAGFIVGVVDESKIINGSAIREGDVCIGLPSNGLHTNGYTLARKIAFEIGGFKPDDQVDKLGTTVYEALMKVHVCYSSVVHPIIDKCDIHGMAHITGGGIGGNLKRVMPDDLSARINLGSWPIPPVFEFLSETGGVETGEMYSAFNMGIGYILVAAAKDAEKTIEMASQLGTCGYRIGEIVKGKEKVRLIKR